jgi:hypothetical protein
LYSLVACFCLCVAFNYSTDSQTKQTRLRNLAGEEGRGSVIGHDEERDYLAAAPDLLRDFATISLDAGLRFTASI